MAGAIGSRHSNSLACYSALSAAPLSKQIIGKVFVSVPRVNTLWNHSWVGAVLSVTLRPGAFADLM